MLLKDIYFVHYHMHKNLKHHKYLKPWENVKLLFVLVVDNKEKLKFISWMLPAGRREGGKPEQHVKYETHTSLVYEPLPLLNSRGRKTLWLTGGCPIADAFVVLIWKLL